MPSWTQKRQKRMQEKKSQRPNSYRNRLIHKNLSKFAFRYFFTKKLLIYLVVFLFPFPPLALGSNLADDKYGGQLVLSTTSDPRSFNSIIAQETSTTEITSLIFEGLTRTNGITLEVEPHLAERWEVSEGGMVWIFHLRHSVVWSDGHPFGADDVVFTFNDLIYNDKIPTSARDAFTVEGKIFKVEKIDEHTVRFELPVRFAPFLRGMGQAILHKHKLE